LGCELATAVGYLELLWHFTAEFAPQGDIGKYDDRRIEAAMGFLPHAKRKSGRLVLALIDSHWIDQDPTCRLRVHHWADHCESNVHVKLSKSGRKVIPNVGNGHLSTSQRPANDQLMTNQSPTKPLQEAGNELSTESDQSLTEISDTKNAACLALPSLALPSHSLALPPAATPAREPDQNPPPPTPNARWKTDETFVVFKNRYQQTGAALIEPDFNKAFEYCWKTLDWEQKADRVKALEVHFDEYVGDPRFVPKPLAFLEQEWQRPVKPLARRVNGASAKAEEINREWENLGRDKH
jgi:hypothetical protein